MFPILRSRKRVCDCKLKFSFSQLVFGMNVLCSYIIQLFFVFHSVYIQHPEELNFWAGNFGDRIGVPSFLEDNLSRNSIWN